MEITLDITKLSLVLYYKIQTLRADEEIRTLDILQDMEKVRRGKAVAANAKLYSFKPYIGHKLGQELVDSGIPLDYQQQLNYSNVNKEEAFKLLGYSWSDWVVLYKDLNGNPYLHNGQPFYRFKPDAGQLQPKDGKTAPKYLSIKGLGCRPYYSPFLDPAHIKNVRDVIWTEGEKKADSLNFHGFPTIGLAGVDCWRDGRSTEMLPELEAINWRGRNCFIAFDSDVVTKDSVKRALKALTCKLTEKGAKVRIAALPCDLDGTKNGADDFLVKYGKDILK